MTESDVRDAIAAALVTTNLFDANGVWLFDPADVGEGTDVTSAAWIEPLTGSIRDEWDAQSDAGITVTVLLRITVAYRNENPLLRDRGAEKLFNAACSVLNGQVLIAGFTIPAWTRFLTWTWSPPAAPERQIVCTFQYQYEIEGWTSFDTTEED
jgi:hypothetical protein